MYDKYFSQYIGDINDILDKKSSRFEKSIRTFSSEKLSDSRAIESLNEQVALGSRSELQSLFGRANGCRSIPTIGTHPDFTNMNLGDSMYQYCVSMFIDIKGSTNLALKYSLEEVRQMKDAVLSLCIHTATVFGGHIQRLQGDGLYVQFTDKYVVFNDMIINALNTASILCHFVSTVLADSLNSRGLEPMRIKVGIDYGDDKKVLWSHYGVIGCNELTATSMHVDLAAKLQARAASNEIRIGQNVKDALDLPEDYISIPLKDAKEEMYIKSVINYRQYIFNWRSYLQMFDFIRPSAKKQGELEIQTPKFRITCKVQKENNLDAIYFQNIAAIDKTSNLEYSLMFDNRLYHKAPHESITWTIHNRGKEAAQANQLKFENTEYRNQSTMHIGTQYLGHHYVECVINRGNFQDNIRVKFGIFIR